MVKYWGIWNKRRDKWWTASASLSFLYTFNGVKNKKINDIPIWGEQNRCERMVRFLDNIDFEIREFTPIDALLAKCGKND